MPPDVVVIGAGSAGLQAARSILEKTEYNVLVVEEHHRIGYPEHCTGLVSLKGIREALRVPLKSIALNYFKGAYIYSPNGSVLRIERRTNVAAAINRPLYEQTLYEEIAGRAEVLLSVRAGIAGEKVKVGERVLAPKFTIDATGIQRLASRHLEAKKWILPAIQFDIRATLEDTEHVYVFIGSFFSKGLFAWAVPLGDNECRVGLASTGNVLARLEYLLRKIEELTRGYIKPLSRIRVLGGAVYTGGLVGQSEGNVLYIGDSAGQTKPTTGGGLVYHSIASLHLAESLSQESPHLYEKRIRKTIGREIYGQFMLRRLLNSIEDRKVNELFDVIKKINGEEIISVHGDMDMQTGILYRIGLQALRKSPSVYLKLLPLFFNLLVS